MLLKSLSVLCSLGWNFQLQYRWKNSPNKKYQFFSTRSPDSWTLLLLHFHQLFWTQWLNNRTNPKENTRLYSEWLNYLNPTYTNLNTFRDFKLHRYCKLLIQGGLIQIIHQLDITYISTASTRLNMILFRSCFARIKTVGWENSEGDKCGTEKLHE